MLKDLIYSIEDFTAIYGINYSKKTKISFYRDDGFRILRVFILIVASTFQLFQRIKKFKRKQKQFVFNHPYG